MSVKQVTIGGRTYILGRLQHTPSQEVFFTLVKNLGPAAGEVFAQIEAGKGLLDSSLSPRAMGRAIQDVCLRLNATDAKFIGDSFGAVCSVVVGKARKDLTPAFMESHFSGHLGEWFQWVWECVQHNYSDFLGLLTRASESAESARQPSPAATESEPE